MTHHAWYGTTCYSTLCFYHAMVRGHDMVHIQAGAWQTSHARGRPGKERKGGAEKGRKEGRKARHHRHRQTKTSANEQRHLVFWLLQTRTQILWLILGWQRLKKRGNIKAPLGSVIMRSTGEQQQRRSRCSSRSRSSRSRRLLMLRLRLRRK